MRGPIVLAAWLAVCAPAWAQQRTVPAVIHDAGGEPIAGVMQQVVPDNARRQAPAMSPAPVPVFPVVTTRAKPGLLGQPTRAKLKGGPGVPICVIGDDQLSRHWLSLNRVTLERMGASCLVVAVSDFTAYRNLQAAAGTLTLAPGSLDALATAAGITVWPVLISPDGAISQ